MHPVARAPYILQWYVCVPSRLSYAAKLVLAAVEGRHVESAVDLLVLKGGFVNPLSYPLYRQARLPSQKTELLQFFPRRQT